MTLASILASLEIFLRALLTNIRAATILASLHLTPETLVVLFVQKVILGNTVLTVVFRGTVLAVVYLTENTLGLRRIN